MKSHGLDMRGQFKIERVSSLPEWTAGDEGREVYLESNGKRYFADSTGWNDYAVARTASDIDYNTTYLPHENVLQDNGRYAGLDALYKTSLSDSTDPFSQGFLTAYNSSTFAEDGKFIFNNTDYGGTAGSMTQTTIDLVDTAIGRTGNDLRYGTEFRICGMTAGSGTSSSASFPGGTRYLMCTQSIYPILGMSGYLTFATWIRAVGGTIGLYVGGETLLVSVDGTKYYSSIDLSTSSNWVFMYSISYNQRGYSSGFERIYGNNGTKAQLALTVVYNGWVEPSFFYCPIISTVRNVS